VLREACLWDAGHSLSPPFDLTLNNNNSQRNNSFSVITFRLHPFIDPNPNCTGKFTHKSVLFIDN
jgi:hypothetical protein